MFRLTLVLLAGLYATMVIWGEPDERDVTVTRNEALLPAIPALAAAAAVPEQPQNAQDLSDVSAEEAVELALSAGEERAQTPTQTPTPVSAKPEPEVYLWYVTGSRVNLRSGPSTSAAIVGGVSLGDRAEVLSDPGESWTRIRTERGLEGWIYSRFLSETPA